MPTEAKRSGGTLCSPRSSFLIRPFEFAAYLRDTALVGAGVGVFALLTATITGLDYASAAHHQVLKKPQQGIQFALGKAARILLRPECRREVTSESWEKRTPSGAAFGSHPQRGIPKRAEASARQLTCRVLSKLAGRIPGS